MMVKCLSCEAWGTDQDLPKRYHKKCSRQLFGTAKPPDIPFKSTDVISEAQKMVGRMSISGVQPKLSVVYDRNGPALNVVNRGGLLILKPQMDRFDSLPENENLCMNIASAYGIEVPAHGLLPLKDGKLSYVVKRFDRLDDGAKIQQEDFQQLLKTDDKYAGSYERIANFIKRHSDVVGLDLLRLFERALLFYVLGNGDAHLKNFSLLRREGVGYELSPAYDIVNSRLVLPEEKEDICLSLQGKKNRISQKGFMGLSKHFGLTPKQTDNAFTRLNDMKDHIEDMINGSFLKRPLRERFLNIFRIRMKMIFP